MFHVAFILCLIVDKFHFILCCCCGRTILVDGYNSILSPMYILKCVIQQQKQTNILSLENVCVWMCVEIHHPSTPSPPPPRLIFHMFRLCSRPTTKCHCVRLKLCIHVHMLAIEKEKKEQKRTHKAHMHFLYPALSLISRFF